jgi:membrane protein required for beta-lactamase induction
MAVTAPFSLIYIPRTLIMRGNATATANNILAHETLFRLGIVAELITSVIFVFVVMALYRLLSGVNKTHASLMVALVVVSAAVGFMNVLNSIVAFTLFRGADSLAVFEKPQRDALAMLFLSLHSQGLVINEIFSGLWLFPFGVLVMRSRFLPRLLASG